MNQFAKQLLEATSKCFVIIILLNKTKSRKSNNLRNFECWNTSLNKSIQWKNFLGYKNSMCNLQ